MHALSELLFLIIFQMVIFYPEAWFTQRLLIVFSIIVYGNLLEVSQWTCLGMHAEDLQELSKVHLHTFHVFPLLSCHSSLSSVLGHESRLLLY